MFNKKQARNVFTHKDIAKCIGIAFVLCLVKIMMG
nr:MAG TPA: hypothetical protein [Caudoviricetes sp.]